MKMSTYMGSPRPRPFAFDVERSTRIVDAGIAIECCLGERVRIELGIGMAPDLGDLGGSQAGGFLKRDEGSFLR